MRAFAVKAERIPSAAQSGAGPLRGALPSWCRDLYWLALLPVLPVLITRFYYPVLVGNEAGKLLAARRILEPAFLGRDWLQAASGDDVLYSAFSALVAPLWLLLKDAILVVLVGRLLVWALLFYALARLARTLEIDAYALAIGLAVWVFRFQSLGAGEWIFGGIEGKCVAYALLFLAMESALRKRVLAAAVYCGFSIWFHILVGGWGALALCGALLIGNRGFRWRRALQFCAIVGTFLLPLVVMFLHKTSDAQSSGSSGRANRLIVLFRNPHHLDPDFFHGNVEFLLACLLTGITVFGLHMLVSQYKATLISAFLVILLMQFGAGLIARRLGLFWFLKSYPFRVADVLVGLLCWITAPMLALWLLKWVVAPRFRALVSSVLLFGVGFVVLLNAAPAIEQHLGVFQSSWSRYLRHDESPWEEMTRWIRQNTPQSSILIAPPWEETFWVQAERAEVVNFKRAPHSLAILQWNQRMMVLNGGPFHSRGDRVKDELQQHYPELAPAAIDAVRRDYGADYYLNTKPRPEMSGQLVHANGNYFLYQLHP